MLDNLYLQDNQLTSLPPEIGNLGLGYLDLSRNQLTSVPSEIGSLRWLGTLRLDSNQLTTLPPEIGMTSLTELYLSANQLTSLPDTIWSMSRLHLDIRDNVQLCADIPDTFSGTVLDSGCCLMEMFVLHDAFQAAGSLPSSWIGVSGNPCMWPGVECDDGLVTELWLENNQLTSLPPEIGSLTSLAILFLNDNQLTDLPSEIGSLTSLQYLHLNSNELASLPDTVWSLSGLYSDLRNNAQLCIDVPDTFFGTVLDSGCCLPPSSSPSRTPTPSHILTPTPTASTSRTPSASRTPTPTSTPTRTLTPTASPSPSRTTTTSHTPTNSITSTRTPSPTQTPSPSPRALITDSRPRSGTVSLDSVWYGDIQLKSDKGTQLVSVSLDSRGSVEVFLSDPNDLETSMWSLDTAGVLEIDLDDDRLHDTNVLRVRIKGTSQVPTSFQLVSCRSERLTAEFVQGTVSDNEYVFCYVPTTTSERDLEITLVPLGHPPSEPFLYVSRTIVAPTRDMSQSEVPWKYEDQSLEQSHTIESPVGPYYVGVYGHVGGAFKVRGRLLDHDDDDILVPALVPVLVCVVLLLAVIVFVLLRKKAHRHRVQRESIRPLPSSTVELRPVEYESESHVTTNGACL